MRHIDTEKVMEYLDGRASVESKAALENHVLECGECAVLKQEVQALVLQLGAEAAVEPPAELVQWAVNLFQPLLRPSTGGKLRKLVAALIFDTLDQPLQAGVRGVVSPSRQLLYRAGDVDVDVKIESKEVNDQIALAGQVLSPTQKFFDHTPVSLESHSGARYRTTTNLVGEFSFDDLPKDTYHLCVDLPEGQITLFCVHRGNS